MEDEEDYDGHDDCTRTVMSARWCSRFWWSIFRFPNSNNNKEHNIFDSSNNRQHIKPNTRTHYAHTNVHLFKIGVLTSCNCLSHYHSFPLVLVLPSVGSEGADSLENSLSLLFPWWLWNPLFLFTWLCCYFRARFPFRSYFARTV